MIYKLWNYSQNMDVNTISVDDKIYNEDKSLVLIKGLENPKLKGCVFNASTNELLASSFMDVETIEYDKRTFKSYFKEGENQTISMCYQGPLVIVRFDKDGKMNFYNTKRHDCQGSFWGNKQEKFGDIFLKHGGQKFLDTVEKVPSVAHHFMIMTPSLISTSRIDFRNNEGLVVYLGTVSLDGTILNPATFSPDVYYYHDISNYNFLPTKEEVNERILIPSRLNFQAAEHILENGYQKNQPSDKIDKTTFNGECVIVRINNRKIIKFVPKCQKLRDYVAGKNFSNIKNRLYIIMEESKNVKQYKENFPLVGSLEKECIEALRQTDKNDTAASIETFLETFDNYVETDIRHRMCNIFLVCILCCPLTKVDLYIDAWFSYLTVRDTIFKFIKEKNGKIRGCNYDETLSKFHFKALQRIKDMAKISKEYATTEKNGHTYVSKLEYSIRGMVRNEFGPNLYKIDKALQYLKSQYSNDQESQSMEM